VSGRSRGAPDPGRWRRRPSGSPLASQRRLLHWDRRAPARLRAPQSTDHPDGGIARPTRRVVRRTLGITDDGSTALKSKQRCLPLQPSQGSSGHCRGDLPGCPSVSIPFEARVREIAGCFWYWTLTTAACFVTGTAGRIAFPVDCPVRQCAVGATPPLGRSSTLSYPARPNERAFRTPEWSLERRHLWPASSHAIKPSRPQALRPSRPCYHPPTIAPGRRSS
jgi:hypothetical protein